MLNNQINNHNNGLVSISSSPEDSTLCLDFAPFFSIILFLSAIILLFLNGNINIIESIAYSSMLVIVSIITKMIKSKINQNPQKRNLEISSASNSYSYIEVIDDQYAEYLHNTKINDSTKPDKKNLPLSDKNPSSNDKNQFISPEKEDQIQLSVMNKCEDKQSKTNENNQEQKNINDHTHANHKLNSKIIEEIADPLDISYDETKENKFTGIINYLSRKCKGNVHLKRIVKVTSSSVMIYPSKEFIKICNAYNSANFNNGKTFFESANEPNSWLCFDFRNLKVRPNMYSIQLGQKFKKILQHWVIEGSNNGKNWTILDERRESSFENNEIFEINSVQEEWYRFLRLRQTDKNGNGQYSLCISSIEFYGQIVGKITRWPKHQSNHRLMKRKNSMNNISFNSNPIEETVNKHFEIKYDQTESGRFNGIIHYLSLKCGGNVHKKGVVEITSSSVAHSTFFSVSNLELNDGKNRNPYNCADLENENNCFESNDLPNSWICYDFQNLSVKLNCYSIRSYVNGKNHLISWCIEASNDKVNWTVLDERNQDNSLNGIGKENSFFISSGDDFFRYLRLRQIGKGANGKYMMNISAIDFFGFFCFRDSVENL